MEEKVMRPFFRFHQMEPEIVTLPRDGMEFNALKWSAVPDWFFGRSPTEESWRDYRKFGRGQKFLLIGMLETDWNKVPEGRSIKHSILLENGNLWLFPYIDQSTFTRWPE